MPSWSLTDTVWMLVCVCLVVFMQAGFGCLEAGFVRSKNSISVVMKNIADLCVSLLGFGFVGFSLMFYGQGSFVGDFSLSAFSFDSNLSIVFLFNALFCSTALTIVSGASAERISFNGYMIVILFGSCFIYPVVGHWVWGAVLFPEHSYAWLGALGFYDFAGATMVHSVGGWMALATIMVVGPRIGMFGENKQNLTQFKPSSIALSALGVFLIMVGWIGFNGGSTLGLSEQNGSIILVTLLGGVSGVVSACVLSRVSLKKLDASLMINGAIAGLVAITAAADMLTPLQAIGAGALGGLLPQWFQKVLHKLQIDDAVGAVGVHLGGGILATLIAGICVSNRDKSPLLDVMAIQVFGILVIGMFVFFSTFTILRIFAPVINLRVSAAQEIEGLNVSEYGEQKANSDLLQQMGAQLTEGTFDQPILVDSHSESSEIAEFYNSVLNKFNQMQNEKNTELEKAKWMAQHDLLTGLFNKVTMNQVLEREYSRIQRYNNMSSIAVLDVDHFKRVNDKYGHDVGDLAIQHIAYLIKTNIREADVAGRIGGEEFCILLTETSLKDANKILKKLCNVIAQSPLETEDLSLNLTVSIGAASMRKEQSPTRTLKLADTAMYQVKESGRNNVKCLLNSQEALSD